MEWTVWHTDVTGLGGKNSELAKLKPKFVIIDANYGAVKGKEWEEPWKENEFKSAIQVTVAHLL